MATVDRWRSRSGISSSQQSDASGSYSTDVPISDAAQSPVRPMTAPAAGNNERITWGPPRTGETNAQNGGPETSEPLEVGKTRSNHADMDHILRGGGQVSGPRERMQVRPRAQSGNPITRGSIYARRGSGVSARSRQSSVSGALAAAPTSTPSRRNSGIFGSVQGIVTTGLSYLGRRPTLSTVDENPPDGPSSPETPLIMALDGPVYSTSPNIIYLH